MSRLPGYLRKQLEIPGLPVPEPNIKRATQEKRINELASRLLRLELEVSVLRILVEKGGDYSPGLKSGASRDSTHAL